MAHLYPNVHGYPTRFLTLAPGEFTGAVKAAKMSQDVRNKALAAREAAEAKRQADMMESPPRVAFTLYVTTLSTTHQPYRTTRRYTTPRLHHATRLYHRTTSPPHPLSHLPSTTHHPRYLNDKSLTLDSLTRDQQSNLYRALEATLGLTSTQLTIRNAVGK